MLQRLLWFVGAKYYEQMCEALATDPRTTWAWSEYLNTFDPLQVTEQEAQQILSAIPTGDHVEVFADGGLGTVWSPSVTEGVKRRSRRLLARTLRCWIGARPDRPEADVLEGPGEGGFSTWTNRPGTRRTAWETSFSSGWVKVFLDDIDSEVRQRIKCGAGTEILRLPEYGDVPAPPVIDGGGYSVAAPESISMGERSFVTDWRAAEHVALEHMKAIGFTVARLTGGSRDNGIDIIHPDAVAQVKMQGVSVSAPLIQQLRGTRAEVANHIFYSTSGYTAAAKVEAEQSGVALFLMDSGGGILPTGSHARNLLSEFTGIKEGPKAMVAGYVQEVEERVRQAFRNYTYKGWAKWAVANEPRPGVARRAIYYLIEAGDKINAAPELGDTSLRNILNYYRHTDLLAAVYCRELNLDYPGDGYRGPKTIHDFY